MFFGQFKRKTADHGLGAIKGSSSPRNSSLTLISQESYSSILHRQPWLRLRAVHELDCFFHAVHNDIGKHLRVCMEMLQNVSN